MVWPGEKPIPHGIDTVRRWSMPPSASARRLPAQGALTFKLPIAIGLGKAGQDQAAAVGGGEEDIDPLNRRKLSRMARGVGPGASWRVWNVSVICRQ